jgi:heptosyltransferase-2
MVDYYLELCRWLGLDLPEHPEPSLGVSEALSSEAGLLLQKYGITNQDMVVGLNPGAKFGSSKCWPPEYFARLADMLEQQWNCRMLLFVGPGETQIADKIMALTKAKVVNTDPDRIDLGLLKPMIQRCDLLITNDTGPRHYATAFKRPVIVIMGPTDPRYTNSNLEQTIVLRKELPCAPCHRKKCPENHECMRGITPDEVLAAAIRLVSETDYFRKSR